MSFQEKSIWGSLVAILAVFGYFFATLGPNGLQFEFTAVAIVRLVGAVVVLVVVEIVYHVLIAVKSGPVLEDERDQQIESRSYRNAYLLLASGVFLVMFTAVAGSALGRSLPGLLSGTPLAVAHLLLLVLVFAEAAKFLTQLYFYRRGI